MRKLVGLGVAIALASATLGTVAFGASGAAESVAMPTAKNAPAVEKASGIAKAPGTRGATSGAGAASATALSIDVDCASCHVNEQDAYDDEQCLASKHAVLECTACHTDEKGLSKGHKKAKEGVAEVSRLKKSEIDEYVCLACHVQEDLAKATADANVLTDQEGTVVNPHEIPDVSEHEGVTCASCHYMHRDKSALETSPAVCDGCHHDGVYECFTCHA